jgi:hypothetical protein
LEGDPKALKEEDGVDDEQEEQVNVGPTGKASHEVCS